MLRRKIMDDLMAWKSNANHKCLLIKGQRQVGKTFIIKEFSKTYKNSLYIDFNADEKTSRIFDADLNTCEKFQRFIKISDMFNYELIKIKLNSNDDNNIDRILKRVMDYDMFDYNVIGDNVHYSSSYDRDTYYDIKSRKPQYIDDNYFDYVIDNFGTKEELKCKINEISTDIGSCLTLKK